MIVKTAKTSTIPQGTKGPIGLETDPIVQLRVTGQRAMPLDEKTKTFSLGRDGTCNAVLNLPTVSSVHCFLERRPGALRIVDNSTKNGTHFGGAAMTSFELRPGEAFTAGDVTVVALTAPAVAAETDLRRLLGTGNQAAIDRAMQLALVRHAIALVGPRGCGQRDLAAVMHQASARRARRFVPIASIDELVHTLCHAPDRLNHGSYYLHIDDVAELTNVQPAAAATLASVAGNASVTVFVGAADARQLVTHLGMSIDDGHTIAIPPLHDRADDLLGLLEHLLGDEMAKLTSAQRKAIVKYRWPGNLDELRADAPIVRAVLAHGGIRAAERATETSRSTISRVTQKLKLSFKDA